jgi:hypothetical protein
MIKKLFFIFITVLLFVSCTSSEETMKDKRQDSPEVLSNPRKTSPDQDSQGNYIK